MAWGQGKDKQARFEQSQIKKSIQAGLIRIPADDEIVMSCDFKGTFEQFIDKSLTDIPFGESIKIALNDCRHNAILMLHSGALKLASGEEIRKYIPKVFGQNK
jgi:hypothetical protein